MKSLVLLPVCSACAIAHLSVAAAAAPSEAIEVASVDPTTVSPASEAPDPTADAEESAPAPRDPREAKNAIYLDLLGPGLLYSINYDRMLTDDLSVRIGFSYLTLGASSSDGQGNTASADFSYWAVPLTVSYLGIGSHSNMLELGGGPILMHVEGSGIVEVEDEETGEVGASATVFALTGMVGYRHQPADGGFVFRIGASPVMAFDAGFLPWGYLSLGAAF